MRLWLFLSALAHQSPDELTDEVQRTRDEAKASFNLKSSFKGYEKLIK